MKNRKEYFTKKEIAHFLIAVLGTSVAFYVINTQHLLLFLVGLLIISPALLLHELGHKFVAIKYGCDAKFNTYPLLLLLSILISLSGFFIVLFGAVFFEENRKDVVGKIAMSGPVVNLTLAVFFGASYVVSCYAWYYGWCSYYRIQMICLFGAYINAIIAVFNLLPIPPFDGFKIITWNKMYWSILFVLGIGLYGFIEYYL